MIFNELPLPLPFYNDIRKQNRYRKNCTGILDFELISPRDNVLPFQFYRPAYAASAIATFKAYNSNGVETADLAALIPYLGNKLFSGRQYIWYTGTPGLQHDSLLPCGFHFLAITLADSDQVFYSELFSTKDFYEYEKDGDSGLNYLPDYLTLIWAHTCDMGGILYTSLPQTQTVGAVSYALGTYQNKLYLDAFLTHTDPLFVEEVDKDGYGTEIPTFQKWNSRFKTQVIIPDFLKTSLQMMTLHKSVAVVTNEALRTLGITRTLLSIQSLPDAADCLNLADITFEGDEMEDVVELPPACDRVIPAATVTVQDGYFTMTWTNVPSDNENFAFAYSTDSGATWVDADMTLLSTSSAVSNEVLPLDTGYLWRVTPLCENGGIGTAAIATYGAGCTPVHIPDNVSLPIPSVGTEYNYSFTLEGTAPFTQNIVQAPSWMRINLDADTGAVNLNGDPEAGDNQVRVQYSNCSGLYTETLTSDNYHLVYKNNDTEVHLNVLYGDENTTPASVLVDTDYPGAPGIHGYAAGLPLTNANVTLTISTTLRKITSATCNGDTINPAAGTTSVTWAHVNGPVTIVLFTT